MLRTLMLPSEPDPRAAGSPLRFDLTHLTSEAQLLVLLARTSANGTLQVEIQDRLRDRVDWDLLWELAQTHHVVPMVYRMLTAYGMGAVPCHTMEKFRRHVQAGAVASGLLADEVVGLTEAFAAKGIGVIPFGGPTLAAIAYGDLRLREDMDLNFIVGHRSIPQARQLLWSCGYQLFGQGAPGDGRQEPAYSFVKKNGMVRVNLQSAMAGCIFAFDLDKQEFWSHLKPVRLGQRTVMTLGPEELLILLCLHGSQHVWKSLTSVCDVAELVRRRRAIDWSRVLFLSRQWRCRRLLLMGLAMAHTLFDVPLPRVIHAAIVTDRDIGDLVRRMPERLLRVGQDGVRTTDAETLHLTLQDTWIARCAYAFALCRAGFPASMESPTWFRFQGRLKLLYRLLHPIHRAAIWCRRSLAVRRFFVRWPETSS